MFYVSGKKIYLDTIDAKTGQYPEVVLTKNDSGNLMFKHTGKGIEGKPKHRKLMTSTEIFAKKDYFLVEEQAPALQPPAPPSNK